MSNNQAHPNAYEKKLSLREYISEKILMIEDEFCITLTVREVDHFYSLKTEDDVDRYAHQIFTERL